MERSIQALRIDGARLWDSLMAMASIGATPAGGCNRQALTDEDKQGRDLFVRWCREIGCEIRVDRMGNIFARRAGTEAGIAPVITGSHLDTQPTGGKFDGVYGVLAGLEVLRTLEDKGIKTRAPLELVVWTNEEGARFSPAMIGSGVWAGEFTLEYAHSRADKSGKTIGEELARIGYLGELAPEPGPVTAAFEAHIEQGPILEKQNETIGVVTGVQGIRWYDVTFRGKPCHAGPTPMADRRDPVQALAILCERLYSEVKAYSDDARMTCGDLRAEPGSRNTVPEKVVLALDLRHPKPDGLEHLHRTLYRLAEQVEEAAGVTIDVREEWHSPPVQFDESCVAAVSAAVERLGYSHRKMVSGAGHDSVYVSRVAPVSMIFVPCAGGLSHNEAEFAEPAHLEAGCNVLMHAMLDRAGIA
ncbi:Zn-dependent hydrolase [Microbulbifer thermotolerans]|uniref:Zn-dependent hydrolase n=1 Tax=Microbulbifer thermotolerans TaxID=252514 RepID=A0A143HIY3_MICTH|nr:Zn-dependent hydrolase [Microbulbifer thermotolerans]AMX01679.1 Zn-dependent hydrolase [Microbulbifer thermotolerans]MCX2779447.1 Zn-dependent hydrolase [Microbulbifer thermotolerans]MCX2784041.1 Zn-dependent hydrolase [Microbulbifer thermotolerans]MCX2793318.1 Zn-dependent hydrolase [Microbulbifer thermotolerans]MCX2801256.1 Zn-dependent hydrolase [Microbulbifer thermotolerans]